MRPKRYIGVTGFVEQAEVDAVYNNLPKGFDAELMVGALVSSKTLRGQASKWPMRYPLPANLNKIFRPYPNVLNLIHFNTREPEKLFDHMCEAQAIAGPNCHGFQLNLAWPDKRVIERYKSISDFRKKVVVLQCGNNALSEVEYSPTLLEMKVREYGDSIDYVLVDPSGGYGKLFNPNFAIPCFVTLSSIPRLGIGVAGGLSEETIDLLRDLVDFNFSIDAEGRLRDENDKLDIGKTNAYVAAADKFFRSQQLAA